MPDKFKAIVIDNQSEKFSREIKELDVSFLDQGEVLVKVDYSDLNYKDALILNDGGKLVRDFPRIPGIDFSGKVVESSASEFKKDEEVILTGCRVGEMYHGGYSQYAKVKGEFVFHQHTDQDELFMVIKGQLTIKLKDKTVVINPGEFYTVERGVEHKPSAEVETHLLLFEPMDTKHTGDVVAEMTVDQYEEI